MVTMEESPRSPEAKLGLRVEDLWDIQEPQLSPDEKFNACFESIPVSAFPPPPSNQGSYVLWFIISLCIILASHVNSAQGFKKWSAIAISGFWVQLWPHRLYLFAISYNIKDRDCNCDHSLKPWLLGMTKTTKKDFVHTHMKINLWYLLTHHTNILD